MKAAIVEGPGVLRIGQIPEPPMGEYEALCELLYGTICTGTDSHIVDGSFPWISPYPTVLGHESIGRIIQIGSRVRHFRLGDIVTRVGAPPATDGAYSVTWGGFAERGIARDHWAMAADGLPESEWKSYRVQQVVPESIDPRIGPLFITWRETLSYLLRRGFRAGHSVIVLGSGGNGFSFARHAANLGASHVVMIGSPRWEASAKAEAGLTAYLDYRQENLAQELRHILPEGFDYVIDSVGRKDFAKRILPCLKPGGHYALYGLDDIQDFSLNPTASPGPFTFHGPSGYDEAETHQAVIDFVLRGRLTPSPWYDIEKCWPLDEITSALDAAKNRLTLKALIKLQTT